jgi:hypothetical protein
MRALPSTEKQVHPHRSEGRIAWTIKPQNTHSSIHPNSNQQRPVKNAKIGSPFNGQGRTTTNSQDPQEINNSTYHQVEITVRRTHR